MPKLTFRDYLLRHNVLAQLWDQDKRPYVYLSYQQQRDLHDYYVPTKLLNELELRAHRKNVARQNPSLPQRAGRAFAAMYRGEFTTPIRTTTPNGKQVFVRGLARPEIDTELLAKELLKMVKRMTPEERANLAAVGEKAIRERKKQSKKAA